MDNLQSTLQYLISIPPDEGKITPGEKIFKNKMPLQAHLLDWASDLIGEFIDVLHVAEGKKCCAALDYSKYGKAKLRNLCKEMINYIIIYCNTKNVKMLHQISKEGSYLKSIFFLPHNYNKALVLANILWFEELNFYNVSAYQFHYVIGSILGYKEENIEYFVKSRFNIENITQTERDFIKYKLENINHTEIENYIHKYKSKYTFLDRIQLL